MSWKYFFKERLTPRHKKEILWVVLILIIAFTSYQAWQTTSPTTIWVVIQVFGVMSWVAFWAWLTD